MSDVRGPADLPGPEEGPPSPAARRADDDPLAAFEPDPSEVADFLVALAARHELPATPAVLVVGGGSGRLLAALGGRGWRVVGMERDAADRERAERLTRETPGVTVRAGAFGDVSELAAYNLIVGANGSFAHLLTPGERVMVLRLCRRALMPDGVLFLDLPNLLRALREVEPVRVQWGGRSGERVRIVRRQEVNDHAATLEVKESVETPQRALGDMPPQQGRVTRVRRYAITTFPETAYLLREAGFGPAETYTSYAARKPERVSRHRMMIAALRDPRTG